MGGFIPYRSRFRNWSRNRLSSSQRNWDEYVGRFQNLGGDPLPLWGKGPSVCLLCVCSLWGGGLGAEPYLGDVEVRHIGGRGRGGEIQKRGDVPASVMMI
jgi:hypothetical protein